MARFIGYPNRQVLGVFDSGASADRAVEALREAGPPPNAIQRFSGPADAERFDATGEHHGIWARIRRIVQFSLMDQLPVTPSIASAGSRPRSSLAGRGPEPPVASLMKH